MFLRVPYAVLFAQQSFAKDKTLKHNIHRLLVHAHKFRYTLSRGSRGFEKVFLDSLREYEYN